MAPISRDKLNKIKTNGQHRMEIRLGKIPSEVDGEKHLMIGGGTASHASKSRPVKEAIEKEIQKRGISDHYKVFETGNDPFGTLAPAMVVYPEGIYYVHLTPEDAKDIVAQHLMEGKPVERLF